MNERADQQRGRRQRFAAPGGSHDRAIRILSVLFPGLIGVLVAIMVTAPLTPRGEISFLLDRNKVAMLNDRLRALGAMYRGEDDRGRAFSVTAGSAVQHSARQQLVEMKDVTARMLLDDGPAEMVADTGTYDFAHQKITVPGPVNIQTADGYRMVTQGADIDLDHRQLVSHGAVTGRVPSGTFSGDHIIANLDTRDVHLDGHAKFRMVPGQTTLPGHMPNSPASNATLPGNAAPLAKPRLSLSSSQVSQP